MGGIRAVRPQRQEEPPVLPEPFATNLNAKRLPGAAQGHLRDPERGRLVEHLGRRALSIRQPGLEELDGIRQRRTISPRGGLSQERLRRVGCRDAL